MTTILDEILAHKRAEVERARRERPIQTQQALVARAEAPRDFHAAIVGAARRPALIAEVKRASPSAGVIREDFDAIAAARTFAAAGAAALSVLTDERYFGGRLEHVAQVKAATGLPVLRKDFLLDAYQVYESRAAGADAVLLIAEAVDAAALPELLDAADALGMTVLLEVYERESLLRVRSLLEARAGRRLLLGVNNRDLRTQRVDLRNTESLAPLAPPGVPLVAESGIRTSADVRRMRQAGARALLVGETLMRSGDPRATVEELFG